ESGDYAGALSDIEEAARLNPQSPLPIYNRGLVKLRQKEISAALMEFEAALKIDPEYTVAYLDRGAAHERQGTFDMARAHCEPACRVDRGEPIGWSRRAWLLAAHPVAEKRNGRNAVGYAKLACELSQWKDGSCTAVLAAAYAEIGKFDDAVKWQQKANENAK